MSSILGCDYHADFWFHIRRPIACICIKDIVPLLYIVSILSMLSLRPENEQALDEIRQCVRIIRAIVYQTQ